MKNKTLPQKDERRAHPAPDCWRDTFREIVSAFVRGDYQLDTEITGVDPVSEDTAKHIKAYIEDYGETLIELPADTWETSEVQWMGPHWDVIVDLWTEREGRSDMILSARVYETGESYSFEIGIVYVP